MIRISHLLLALLTLGFAPGPALAELYFRQRGGQVYVHLTDGTTVDAVAGTGLDAGTYSVSDAALAAAGLTDGKHLWRAFLGTAATAAASDTPIGVSGELYWDATANVEIVQATQADVAGVPGLVQDQLIGSGVTVETPSTWQPDTPLGAMQAATERLTLARAAKIDRIQDSGTVATSTEASSGGGGGSTLPLIERRRPAARRVDAYRDATAGLTADSMSFNRGGSAVVVEIDFRADLATGNVVFDAGDVTIEGSPVGLTIAKIGRIDTKLVISVTPASDMTAGAYDVRIPITYGDSAGAPVFKWSLEVVE